MPPSALGVTDSCTLCVCADIPLSVGILDPRASPTQLNAVEFLWDPSKRASAFIQVRGPEVTLCGKPEVGSVVQFLRTIPAWACGLLLSVVRREAEEGGRVEFCIIRASWSWGRERTMMFRNPVWGSLINM